MSSHRTQILLRKAAAQIVFHEFAPESPNVLITFGALGDGMAEWGFGTDFARKCGVNNVFVSKKKKTYYQDLSGCELLEALRPLGQRNFVTYGASAGGYAAIYYGSFINARIFAAAPRNSIHPILSKAWESLGDRDVVDEFKHSIHLHQIPKAEQSPLILIDFQQNRDAKMLKRWILPAYPDSQIKYVPRAGHSVLTYLRKFGQLSSFSEAYIMRNEVQELRPFYEEGTKDRVIDDFLLAVHADDLDGAAGRLNQLGRDLNKIGALSAYANLVLSKGARHHADDLLMRLIASRSLNLLHHKFTKKLQQLVA